MSKRLVFGVDTLQTVFEEAADPASGLWEASPNPMVRSHGPGPEGKTCQTCKHLAGHRRTKTYYKCELRGFSHGAGTDQRVRWQACSKYDPDGTQVISLDRD